MNWIIMLSQCRSLLCGHSCDEYYVLLCTFVFSCQQDGTITKLRRFHYYLNTTVKFPTLSSNAMNQKTQLNIFHCLYGFIYSQRVNHINAICWSNYLIPKSSRVILCAYYGVLKHTLHPVGQLNLERWLDDNLQSDAILQWPTMLCSWLVNIVIHCCSNCNRPILH